jgi:hypothetical protein
MSNYRYNRFTTNLLFRDLTFKHGAAAPGDRVPAFELITTGGERLVNDDLFRDKLVLFVFGSVVFVDAGNVWEDDQDIDLGDLNWSTGFGFRISMANIPKQPILRIDFGWALGSDHNFEVTVGAEQQF